MKLDELAKRRREKLVERLVYLLKTYRTVVLGIDEVENVPEWRSAAREAGRRLNIRVSTGVSRDGTKVWATEEPETFPSSDPAG
jgi:hypothetical protein